VDERGCGSRAARAVLLAAGGTSISEIARQVSRDRGWVREWIRRFGQHRLVGDTTRPEPAARRSFPPEERHDVVGLAYHPQAELAVARTHWAVRPLAEVAFTGGYIPQRISKSTVQRWLHSPDPDFRRRVRRVVRWYLRPPRGTHVICVDEKTQVQILEGRHRGAPMRAGVPQRLEVHCRRHGTLAVLAGFAVRSGQVVVRIRPRRRGDEFLELLDALRARWPRGRLVVVLDNLSVHSTPALTAWLRAQQGRVRFEFLPLHAS
jgi:transposase-like protein